jgi:hypothetical protein
VQIVVPHLGQLTRGEIAWCVGMFTVNIEGKLALRDPDVGLTECLTYKSRRMNVEHVFTGQYIRSVVCHSSYFSMNSSAYNLLVVIARRACISPALWLSNC